MAVDKIQIVSEKKAKSFPQPVYDKVASDINEPDHKNSQAETPFTGRLSFLNSVASLDSGQHSIHTDI